MRRLITRQLVLSATALLLVAGGFGASQLIFPTAHARAASQFVGPKHYYLGLGDSLAFGYQPDLNWDDGYVQDFYNNLQSHGVSSLTNFGCNGEKSTTMITGGCPYQIALHNYYLGSQLNAAVGFLHSHAGQVSPVTLNMGANDLIPDINSSTCTVAASWTTDLATLQANLANTILPQITAAMKDGSGNWTGDLVMMNYYDPYSKVCPNSLSYVQQLNATINTVAAQFGVHVADVYSAFGGANMGSTICTNTWICNWLFHDIHATNTGYQIIANAFAATTGY